MAVTAKSMPNSTNDKMHSLYLAEVASLAMNYDYLLYAMLAIAALHASVLKYNNGVMSSFGLKRSDPARVPEMTGDFASKGEPFNDEYVRAHQLYLDKAVKEQREAISNITKQNGDAIIFTTLLLSVAAFASSPKQAANYSTPVLTYSMIRSIWTVLHSTKTFEGGASIIRAVFAAEGPAGQGRQSQNLQT